MAAENRLTQLDDEKGSKDHLESFGAHASTRDDENRHWGVRTSLKVWRRGVGWSLVMSLAIIMESYDTILKNTFYAMRPFQCDLGVQLANGECEIPSKWQAGINAGSSAAMIIGIFVGTPLVDRYGHVRVMQCGLVLNAAFVFITFFAQNVTMYLVGTLLCALPWGLWSVSCPAYAVEIVPTQLRSYLVSYVNLCWVIGHVLAAGILRGFVNRDDEWAWRIPIALQWALIPFIFVLMCFAPSTPYWLVRRGRIDEAKQAVARLHEPNAAIDDDRFVKEIEETVKMEKEMKTGGSFAACFRPQNIRRTEVATIIWVSQALLGYVVQFFATFFFVRAGLPREQSFSLGLGNYAIAAAGTITSWWLQYQFGRRSIIIGGYIYMMVFMLFVGCLDFATGDSGRWAQCIMLMLWFYGYGCTAGPVAYVVASEISAVRLRTKTLAIARNSYYLAFMSAQILSPYFLQTWDLKGKSAFPAFGFTVLLLNWAWWRLPEAKGRSYQELDILFALKLPARRFKGYVITDEDRARFHTLQEEQPALKDTTH